MRRALIALGIAGALAVALSCRNRSGPTGREGDGSGELDAGSFDKRALLRAFGECALGTYTEFGTRANALDGAVRAAETDPTKRTAAQDAWKRAIEAWQRAEVMQFGPAAMTGAPGAQDLRDPIYSWPLVKRCEIEKVIADKSYEAPDFTTKSLVNVRTLGALDYLLFYEGTDTECVDTTTWGALGADELAKRKATYARVVASDVAGRAQRLVDAWQPGKGSFLDTFASAPNATFATQQMAFNSVSDAMFYLDNEVKNMKVGLPAGLTPECGSPPCLSGLESRFAKNSKQDIRANLDAFDQLFRGCGPGNVGLGFDDLLVAVGATQTADKIVASIVAVRTALDALTGATLEDDILKNPAGVKALFDALRASSSLMKSEFVTVLDLELPKRVEGDND